MAHGIIAVQNWVLMVVAYGVGMGPVALVMRLKNPDLIDMSGRDVRSCVNLGFLFFGFCLRIFLGSF